MTPGGSKLARASLASGLVVLTLALVACDATSSDDVAPATATPSEELLPLPEPDLTGAERAVKEQVETGQRALASLRADPGVDPEALAEAYGDLGLVYVTYSFLQAAEAAFKNARSLSPRDFRWPYLLGYLYQIQGRLTAAAEALESALDLRPGDLPSLLRLGTVRLEEGDPEGALPLFEGVLEADPESAAAFDGLGKVAQAMGDTSLAVERFEQALKRQPSASSVRYALGLAYRRLGDLERARELLQEGGDAAVLFPDPVLNPVGELGRSAELYLVTAAQAFSEERWDRAAASYRQALELSPHDFTARKALGFCLEKLGDVDGALEELQKALRLGRSEDLERESLEKAEIYRILGGLQVLYGREPEALESFARALELNPDLLDARLKLANALARARRFGESLEHYDRVLAAKPDHVEARVQRATALINLQRGEEALAEFRRALEQDPENPLLRQRHAEALEHLGRSAEARQERAQVARLSHEDQARSEVLSRQAEQLLARGNAAGAAELYRELLRLDPRSTDTRYQLAAVLGELRRFEEALPLFAEVLEEAPHHAPARQGQVIVLLLQERYGLARARLQEGLRVMPGNRSLAHALARLLASAPDAKVRDGSLAVELANRVFEARRDLSSGETLAMAYAEAGQFQDAVVLQTRLLQEVEGRGDSPRVELLRRRLAAYEARTPWRASPAEIIQATLLTGMPRG